METIAATIFCSIVILCGTAYTIAKLYAPIALRVKVGDVEIQAPTVEEFMEIQKILEAHNIK